MPLLHDQRMPFDFAAVTAPFRMQPGLRKLTDGEAQLTPNRPGDAALVEKLAVLTDHRNEALLMTEGIDTAPMLRTLVEQACGERSHSFRWDGTTRWEAPLLGWSLHDDRIEGDGPAEIGACLRRLPNEWRLTGLLALAFAEDFALIDATSGRVPWMAVCLPSHWAPDEKIGGHFTEIHAPVADNASLLAASGHLMKLVTGDQRWERFVWTITPHPQLRQHPRHLQTTTWCDKLDADELAASATFRTERQTFIPIGGCAQAIFTIHVEVQPLTHAITRPAQARALHDALASMSPAVLAYRGLTDARERLLRWLA